MAVTVEQCWHRVPGGTATSTLGTLRALAARGDLDLVGVAARHPEPPPAAFTLPIPVQHLPLPRPALYEAWHALRWPSIERATGPVDVVHATAIAVPPTKAPLVMTIHDLAFLADPTQPTRHGLRFFTRGTELARRHARLVLVPSEATAAECREHGFDADRIRLVPWGVDVAPVTEEQVAAARRRRGLERPYVLFVGTMEPRKNLRGLIDAMARLAGRELDLVLVGPEGWNEDVAALLGRLSGTGIGVHALGFLPPDDLPPLYAGCAAFCFPSLREGFGMPVLEAMAHGAPVVTSSGTATAEIAGDDALLVDPEDHEALAVALARILDDGALADDLRARGRARAATFTWERTAELTAAAYAELAP
ncbi:MAG: glycosyl transferase, group 1 [Ilumatobacteraceae bacterium]|nr:glycosyl transferase, group 1 [Ilumatobacteraceae bacterium]